MARSTSASTRLVVGNWKMNGRPEQLRDFCRLAQDVETFGGVRVGLCPPASLLHQLSTLCEGTLLLTGGQDCHAEPSGAFTGDLSATMLADAGARLVILGHSERRVGHGEDDGQVASKVRAAVAAGLEPIICVGESLAQREAGTASATVCRQLRGSLPPELARADYAVAYEPVWAIGTGRSASPAEIAQMHELIGSELHGIFPGGARAPILYGGSVSGGSARSILAVPAVDGVLVGGASLSVESFLSIVRDAATAVATL
jgi:triosephosphate isomerase